MLAVVALLWLKSGGATGGGYDTLAGALTSKLAVEALLALCVMKLAATIFFYGSGGAGGFLDQIPLHHTGNEVAAFALVGMSVVFARSIRAPITSVLIIFEITGSYGLSLTLMIANMTAYSIAHRKAVSDIVSVQARAQSHNYLIGFTRG